MFDFKYWAEAFQALMIGIAALAGALAGERVWKERRAGESAKKRLRRAILNKYPREMKGKSYKLVDTKRAPGMIYLVDIKKGTKRWIQSGDTYKDLNYSWSDYETIDENEFDEYTEGDPILTSGRPGQ